VTKLIKKYKKILLITSSSFNSYTGTGITLSNLFEGWPLDSIAIINSDKFKTSANICRLEYKLGDAEQSYIFRIFKRKADNRNFSCKGDLGSGKKTAGIRPYKYLSLLHIKRIVDAVVGDYSILIKQRTSKQLLQWVDDFKPDLLYLHFSSIGSLRFCKAISEYCQIPYAVHFMDDYYHFKYTRGILSPFLKRIWKKEVKEFVKNASLRLGISEKMSLEYSNVFNVGFYHFFNIVDAVKWDKIKTPENNSNSFNILYAGTINDKNIKSLHIIAEIIEGLKIPQKNVSYSIYTFQPRADSYSPQFDKYLKTNIYEVPEGDAIIQLLKNSDLLLLSIDFTPQSISRMRLSMFTKIPAYMISGTPILFWGPKEIASTEYAKNGDWAVVVDENNSDKLKKAIVELIVNESLRKTIVNKARMLVEEKHSAHVVKKKFHGLLNTME